MELSVLQKEIKTRIIDQYRRGNFPYVNAAELAMLQDAKVAAVIAYRARASTYLHGTECKPKKMSLVEAITIIEYEISFRENLDGKLFPRK